MKTPTPFHEAGVFAVGFVPPTHHAGILGLYRIRYTLGVGPILDRMAATRHVACSHIIEMTADALEMAKELDGEIFPAPPPGGYVEGADAALRSMERAVNLLRHAAEELEDERLRLRDGWT